jgi:oxygen-independent coproporphyrinogen-3 oxidase
MGQTRAEWDDDRLELYRRGRAMLLSRGYRQISMRMFRSEGAPDPFGPVYRCQADGMVGLGCGARSYTQQLHYSSAYAVGPMNVKGIIRDFVARSDAEFERAGYGFALDEEEVRRRHAIVSLLSEDGLDRAFYSRRFDADPVADMPELLQLMSTGLAEDTGATINLTEAGLERSDAVGPWLFTRQVKALMGQYEAK